MAKWETAENRLLLKGKIQCWAWSISPPRLSQEICHLWGAVREGQAGLALLGNGQFPARPKGNSSGIPVISKLYLRNVNIF